MIDSNIAIETLRSSIEMWLISFRYDATARQFMIVTDFARDKIKGTRTFIRFVCNGVTEMTRIGGLNRELQRFRDSYSAQPASAPLVLQTVRVSPSPNGINVLLGLGSGFGQIVYECADIKCEYLIATVRNVNGTWEYSDAGDGSIIDCFDPFKHRPSA